MTFHYGCTSQGLLTREQVTETETGRERKAVKEHEKKAIAYSLEQITKWPQREAQAAMASKHSS